ncbi:uncharacterized protein LOC112344584 [Selaginella moellendorffii]|uniref:uncharacterized protein LOC112344584 n=1 Tax=Selaginella moellendorffii TaxID=88036 RepID=UPI000D1CE085|nr:uncharacterized protein LOC112344584 [Selaginella moellendorffii]|eukprot:XP_024525377.1 uncharacterized protein LOC112344584 [Selaginella moellendorffii]
MAAQEEDATRLRLLLESSSSSLGDIAAACHAVESVSRHLPRSFFCVCFPLLLRRLFGFKDFQAGAVTSSEGWLSVVSQPGCESAATVVIALLAPGSSLFKSLLASDSESVVRYVFPFERLPEWVRRLLAVEGGGPVLEHVSILFRKRLKEDITGSIQIELDIFQYYIFWFAYYAVCKESPAAKTSKTGLSRSSQLRSQIESWASSIPGLHHSHQGSLVSPLHPYLQLLQLYLSHFVGPAMIRKDKQVISLWEDYVISHADILVRTLIDFWLIDDDPCPFSLAVCQSLQLHTLPPPSSYVPPGRDLIDAVKLLINYFSALLQTQIGHHEQFFASPESPAGFRRKASLLSDLRASSALNASPYLQSLQRPLYRFFLRAFCLWPVGTSLTKVLPMVDLWLHYLEPWTAILLVPKDSSVQPGSRVVLDESKRFYSAYWQEYVLSNYGFYTSLVSHFLDFALKFLHVDMELVVQATCKVLGVLAKSDDLLDLLRRVNAAYTESFLGRHHYTSNPFVDRVPTIMEQLQDWEEGMTNSEKEHGEILHSSMQTSAPQLHLFGVGEYGGHYVLQSIILLAEAENRACNTDKLPVSPKTLRNLKELVLKVFEREVLGRQQPLRSDSGSPLPEMVIPETNHSEEIPERSPGLQRHSVAEVKYKGDWMRRPIESQEIGWLVRLLVEVSDKLNGCLGFTGGRELIEEQGCSSHSQVLDAVFPEVLKPVARALLAAFLFVVKELRKRGFRINLRPLASKQAISSGALALFFYWLVKKIAGYFFK